MFVGRLNVTVRERYVSVLVLTRPARRSDEGRKRGAAMLLDVAVDGATLLSSRRVDDLVHQVDAVCGKPAAARVLSDHLFALGIVHADEPVL